MSFQAPGFPSIDEFLTRVREVKIIVVGDVMMDEFIYGTVERISPEAPVPVVEVRDERFCLGGAANVVHNLRELGAQADLLGVVGDDPMAERLRQELGVLDVRSEGILELAEQRTTVKTRVIARHQQVVRFDRERAGAVPRETAERLLARFSRWLPQADAVIVSDYGKGVVTEWLMGRMVEIAGTHGVTVAVDPKPVNAECYRGVDLIAPNTEEAAAMAGRPIRTDDDVVQAGKKLVARFGARAVLITRGERGMTLVEKSGGFRHIPTLAQDVFDVTGAGDTAIAVLTAAWAAGVDAKGAANLANLAAGVVVGKLGTATVTPQELRTAAGSGAGRGDGAASA